MRPQPARRNSTSASTAKRRSSELPLSSAPGGSLKKRDQQTKPNMPTLTGIAPRDERKSRLQARERALLVDRDPAGSRASSPRRRRTRRTARSSLRRLAEEYVELEAAAFRDKTRSRDQARRGEEEEPEGGAGQIQTNGEPGRRGPQGRAQEGDRVLHLKTHRQRLPELPTATKHGLRRGPLLPRLRVRAGERPQERAQGLLRPHQEVAELEVHPERVPRASASSSSTRRRATRPSGTSPSRRTRRSPSTRRRRTRSTATPGTSSAYVYWNKGELDKALNGFKKTIEFGTVHTQLPGAAKLAGRRASRHDPGLRPQGRPGAGVQLPAQHLGRR